MDQDKVNIEDSAYIARKHELMRLRKLLNYEISTSALYVMSFMGFFFLYLAIIAALVFTPFMINVLYKRSEYGWIALFGIMIVLPVIILTIIAFPINSTLPLLLIPLPFFYLYCFLLKFSVNNWVRDMNSRNWYLLEKEKMKEQTDFFWKQLDKEIK